MTSCRWSRSLTCLVSALSIVSAGNCFAQNEAETLTENKHPTQFIMSEIVWDDENQKAFLQVSMKLEDGWRIFANEQEVEIGTYLTNFKLESSDQFALTGSFQPTQKPTRESNKIFGDLLIHTRQIDWRAEIKVAEGVALKDIVVVGRLRFNAQTDVL